MEFRDFISELKNKSDIVSVIGRYVTLERRGNQFWACCPFHHEKTPSFSINQIQQYYHCFGCKESGDVIKFVQKMDSIDFIDAVKKLADSCGMEMPKMKETDEAGINKATRDRQYAVLKDAARHYYTNLVTVGDKAMEYLKGRGISKETITAFGMGYSIDGNAVIEFLRSRGHSMDDIKAAGVALEYDGRTYDPFFGRLMIPIINRDGKVIGFGGRTLDPEQKKKKYRNSNDGALFNKRNVLFGINMVIKHHREEKFDSLIIVEGYMDVISLYQCGIKNAVACMGTALTSSQARQIRNICDNAYICFDGDAAGRENMLNGLDTLKAAGLNVKVVSLPDGKDPDDVAKQGLEVFKNLLNNAQLLYDYKLNVARGEFDLSQAEEKIKYAVKAVGIIAELENEIERDHFLASLSSISGYSKEHLKRQLAAVLEAKTPAEVRVELPTERRGGELALAVNYILKCAIESADEELKGVVDIIGLDEELSRCAQTTVQRRVLEYLTRMAKEGKEARASDLFTELDESMHGELSDILMSERQTFKTREEATEYLRSCRRLVSNYNLSAERAELLERVGRVDKEQRNEILRRIMEIDSRLK